MLLTLLLTVHFCIIRFYFIFHLLHRTPIFRLALFLSMPLFTSLYAAIARACIAYCDSVCHSTAYYIVRVVVGIREQQSMKLKRKVNFH